MRYVNPMFFYNLYFQYTTAENQISFLNIGYFSTYKKAHSVIETYKYLPGFENYPVENFKIQKFGVKSNKDEEKSGKTLYQLSFEKDVNVFESEWVIFGMYNSYKEACNARRIFEKKENTKIIPNVSRLKNGSLIKAKSGLLAFQKIS